MKLNWFSPLPPAPTGIAEYTGTVLPWLSKHADITLWTDQASWHPAIEKFAPVRRFAPQELRWEDLNDGLTVYNIGNNPEFHRGIWETSQKHSGIVVLHDLRLQDFFWSILRTPAKPAPYADLMERFYGAPGATAAQALEKGEEDLGSICIKYTLAEAAIENALGVVVHTPGGFDLLSDKCRPALGYFPFPYASASQERLASWNRQRKTPSRRPYKLVVTGYINPNRRLKNIVEALGKLPAPHPFHLEVYGPLWPEEDVSETIAKLGFERIVTLHGFTPPAELDEALADADLAINLRYPTMGEASMSQLQVWDHALPSIVTRTGWYGTLPENSVLFVDSDREIDDLTRHLGAFAGNPAAFSALGQQGRQILIEHHAPERYVSSLIDFLKSGVKYRPTSAFIKASHRTAATMHGWLRPLAAGRATDRLASTVMAFLPGENSYPQLKIKGI